MVERTTGKLHGRGRGQPCRGLPVRAMPSVVKVLIAKEPPRALREADRSSRNP